MRQQEMITCFKFSISKLQVRYYNRHKQAFVLWEKQPKKSKRYHHKHRAVKERTFTSLDYKCSHFHLEEEKKVSNVNEH